MYRTDIILTFSINSTILQGKHKIMQFVTVCISMVSTVSSVLARENHILKDLK